MAASVELRPVTAGDFRAICLLLVREDQRNFVATNAYSLAEMHFRPFWESRGIHADGEPVGFVMWGRPPDSGRMWICRFMIAAPFQRRGLGRAALAEVLRVLHGERGEEEIHLSFAPENDGARRFYEGMGFRDTGEVDDGERVYRWTPAGTP